MIEFDQLAPCGLGEVAPWGMELAGGTLEARKVSPGKSVRKRPEKKLRPIVIDDVAHRPIVLDPQQDISQIEIGVINPLEVHGANTLRRGAARRRADPPDRSALQRRPEILGAAQLPRDQPAPIKRAHCSTDASRV